MVQIDPDYILDKVDYASTVMYELYRKSHKFYVKTVYNGQTLKFKNCNNEEYCEIDDFFNYMGTRLVIDEASLKDQCSKTATPD